MPNQSKEPTKKKVEGRTLRIGMRRVDGIAARVAVIEAGDEIIKVEKLQSAVAERGSLDRTLNRYERNSD